MCNCLCCIAAPLSLVMLVMVTAQVNEGKKGVSSSSGMQTTVHTSPLVKYRADVVVPARMKAIEKAIHERNFEEFGRITMEVGTTMQLLGLKLRSGMA